MTDFTDYSENELIDHLLGTGSFTAPTNVYASLHTTATSDAGGGTEVSGFNYARNLTTFNAAASGTTTNSTLESFSASGGSWGTITHGAIWDSLTTGNMLLHSALDNSRTINDGDTFEYAIGAISVTFD